MKTTRLFITGLFLVIAVLLPNAHSQPVHVNFDYAVFRYDSTMDYLELYYSFNASELHFQERDSTFRDTLVYFVNFVPQMRDSSGFTKGWRVPVVVRDTSQVALARDLVSQAGAIIPTGRYFMRVQVTDVSDLSIVDSVTQEIEAGKFPSHKLATSDIELCSTISPSEPGASDIFYKNTYHVIPNPICMYGAGMPIIFYYVEVYNIEEGIGDSIFTVSYQLRDSFGEVHRSSTKNRRKFGSSSVEVGTINASNLKTGSYSLIFTVSDSGANTSATSTKRLFVYNPSLGSPLEQSSGAAASPLVSSVFSSMGEEQIDKEFEEAYYLSTSTERDQYQKLSGTEAKRRFIFEFWNKRNTNPVSPVDDSRRQYLERVAYADDHFGAGSHEGWHTDRGRVYIMYGPPDQVDRHPNEMDSKPYEIWYYNSLEGGVTFDFVDRNGFGDFVLVNSTARNEIRDDNWQQYLTTGGR
ncbi:MAG TPA: GWxTD domain-containing protein [Candidatus Kryptonia bacterium]